MLNKTVILSGTPRRISVLNIENRDPSEYLRMTGGEDFNTAAKIFSNTDVTDFRP